jgi:hypothetical protein
MEAKTPLEYFVPKKNMKERDLMQFLAVVGV